MTQILVNGKLCNTMDDEQIDYAEVVYLACGPGEKRLMSVTFCGHNRDGSLRPGKWTTLEAGMRFAVNHTGAA